MRKGIGIAKPELVKKANDGVRANQGLLGDDSLIGPDVEHLTFGVSWTIDPVAEAKRKLPHLPRHQLAENRAQYEGNIYNQPVDLTEPNVVREITE